MNSDGNLKRETARLGLAHAGKVLGLRCGVTKEEDVQGMIREAAEPISRAWNCSDAGLN